MAKCDTCGNHYQDTFSVIVKNRTYEFDCFECAAQALAPSCENCGCRVLGHGVQFDETIFCCANCASAAGATGLTDHAQSQAATYAI